MLLPLRHLLLLPLQEVDILLRRLLRPIFRPNLRHVERLVIQQRNHTFLAQHQLDDSFSLVLREFLLRLSLICVRCLARHFGGCHPQAWLAGVDPLLVLGLVVLPLVYYLVISLLEKHFKLSLLTDVSVVLHPGVFEQTTFIFHLLSQCVDYALITDDLLLFGLNFASRLIYQRPVLLLRRE